MTKQGVPWLRLATEGVVVVMSILLAFGIDAWWEGRQRLSDEEELLVGLLQETTDNLATLRAGLDSLEANRERLSRFVLSDASGFSEFLGDSAWNSVVRPQYRDYSPKLSYGFLDATIAAGKLELIRDVELRAALAGLKRLQDEADGPRAAGARLGHLTEEAALLLGAEREVQIGYADDLTFSPVSLTTLQALRSTDELVALAATRRMLTSGYIRLLRLLEAELVRILRLMEGTG